MEMAGKMKMAELFPTELGETPVASAAPAQHPSVRMAVAAFTVMASVYFFSYFQRAAVPGTIFNELQTDLALSATTVAALGSMFTWIYGGMQIFVGLLADRYGGARTLLGGGLVMAAGALLFPLADSVGLLFAARALTGLGASFMYLSIVKESDRLFGTRHFTVVMGVVLCVGYTGGVTATLPFERVAAAMGWRQALVTVAVMTFAALGAASLILRRLGREAGTTGAFSLGPLAEVLHTRACRPIFASAFICFPVFFVVQTVLGKKFLQDFGGLSSPASAGFIMIMTAVCALCVVLGGFLPRWMGEQRRPCIRTGAVMLVAATVVLLAGTLARAPGWVYLCGYMLLAATGIASPAFNATVREIGRPESAATSLAAINAVSYIGAGTIGQLGGLVLDQFRGQSVVSGSSVIYPQAAYVTLFVLLTLLAFVNMACAWLVPETRGERRSAA